jgi:ABC-type antimicrobial peptide transport system permease subunit
MALGASRGAVLRLVMKQELGACAAGIVVGVAGAVALSSVLQSLLYGVPARDPVTLAGVTAVLVAVTAVAGYLPARKATHIDPVRALMLD